MQQIFLQTFLSFKKFHSNAAHTSNNSGRILASKRLLPEEPNSMFQTIANSFVFSLFIFPLIYSSLMDRVDEIFDEEFTPTNDDILRARVATTGIIRTDLDIEGTRFQLWDVGGQRGERKKFFSCSFPFLSFSSQVDSQL
jgi:hypothetical protein